MRYLWGCEEKVDGWRMLAYKAGDRVRLVSRNGRNHTRRFADLAAAIAKLSARSLVLDGEIAIYDKQLRFRFKWLRELDPGALATPPLFMAFELLYQENRDLTARPLRDRLARPEDSSRTTTRYSPCGGSLPMVSFPKTRPSRLSCGFAA